MLTSFAHSQLFGESYGTESPWVLALHGWRRDHVDFDAVLRRPDELDAIAIDLPGFGATPPPRSAWGSDRYAEALLPVLEQMMSRIVVVGHSLGGRVGVHLAAMAPAQVAGLVLSGAPLFRSPGARRRPPLAYRSVRRLAKVGLVSPEQLNRSRERYGSSDYRAATGVIRDVLVTMLSEHYDDAIRAVNCPVELVWGENDEDAPVEVAMRIRDTLPSGAKLRVLPHVGHMTPLDAPDELRAAIVRLRPAMSQ